MRVGYARVSTGEQNLDLQLDALKKAGCEQIYHDEMSGAKAERPGLSEALKFIRPGDTLVVWRLDRLGRSLKDLIERVAELRGRDIDLLSLHEQIDTTTSAGKLQFHIFSALAEFERDLIRERTMAGLRAARARGKKGGRKFRLTSEEARMAASLIKDKTHKIKDICKRLGISTATLYRYVSPTGELRPRTNPSERA
jgi:DNA invertase Pin-like site-specific DNA recombinase